MSVISIRLTKDEERILSFLTNYFDKDKSTVIKTSLTDMYEDILDREEINSYESFEQEGVTKFYSFEDIIGEH